MFVITSTSFIFFKCRKFHVKFEHYSFIPG